MTPEDWPEYREKLKIFENVLDLNFLQDPLNQTLVSGVNKKEPAIWLKEIVIKRWLGWLVLPGDKDTTNTRM